MRGEQEAEATAHAPSLFADAEDEAIEDLALDAHARSDTDRFADEFMAGADDERLALGTAGVAALWLLLAGLAATAVSLLL